MQIKICGLFRREDAEAVNEACPDYIGFIIGYPKSHRNVSAEKAAELRRLLRPEIKAVAVFVDLPLQAAAGAARFIGADAVQLHGGEDDGYITALRRAAGLHVWKAFSFGSAQDFERARRSAADLILLDGGMGEGRPFDRELARNAGRPFILAGGLTPESIPEAAGLPYLAAVDISSGVETNGVKDADKIRRAVLAAHGGV
ncbi:MAG: phosphoribosylanthranilate isomerase [Abditibacteriota bacterium]|nr:phosphoribosylanthranilate isomerase [Abditibacteriota bacterium]